MEIVSLFDSKARLSAHVVVSVDYPEVAPVFVTSVAWQTQRTAINDIHIKVKPLTELHFPTFLHQPVCHFCENTREKASLSEYKRILLILIAMQLNKERCMHAAVYVAVQNNVHLQHIYLRRATVCQKLPVMKYQCIYGMLVYQQHHASLTDMSPSVRLCDWLLECLCHCLITVGHCDTSQ